MQGPKFFPGSYSELPPWLGRGTVFVTPTAILSILTRHLAQAPGQVSVPARLVTHKKAASLCTQPSVTAVPPLCCFEGFSRRRTISAPIHSPEVSPNSRG